MYEPGIVIREASNEDVNKLELLVKRFYLFNEEFNPFMELSDNYDEIVIDTLEKRLGENNIFLVAVVEGDIAGYVYGVIESNPLLRMGKMAVIKELYVLPIYRNMGVASKLLEEFSSRILKMGVPLVGAEFPTSNDIAKKFYEKNGFKEFRSIYIRVL